VKRALIFQNPIDAIKDIQVLRDGASAQYGSDAIAGVINIILKDSPRRVCNIKNRINFCW
jgi:outer membrane receptor protein involved in Fe transport